jgi:hypothetical protein
MYSPRISDDYIPALYRLARSRGIPMTALVNEAIGALLAQSATQAAIAAMAIPPKPRPSQPAATRAGRHGKGRGNCLDTTAG